MNRLAIALFTVPALCVGIADARVYTLRPSQVISFPADVNTSNGPKVAISGDAVIALVDRAGGRSALLYRRGADGAWALSRTLLDVNGGTVFSSEVSMDGAVAAVKLDDVLHIYERTGAGEWLESDVAGVPRPAPGLVVSGGRILAGRRGCNYDADVFEKSLGSGVWRINGRLAGVVGDCNDHGVALDLAVDDALVRNPGNEVREYRKNGTSWPQVATITPPAGVTFQVGAVTLRQDTAVAPGGAAFARANGAWSYTGTIRPLNYANGAGAVSYPDFGDAWLATIDIEGNFHDENKVYLYRQTSPGQFAHSALLVNGGYAGSSAISQGVAVVGSLGFLEEQAYLSFFALPGPSPEPYVNDFESQSVGGLEQTPGSQFALATVGTNDVYRQSATAGESHAIFGADWNTQSYVEADITPTAFDGNDRWFGLGLRYTDENNFYYVTLRSSGRLEIKRKVGGVFTTLAQRAMPVTLGQRYHVRFSVDGSVLRAEVNGTNEVAVSDSTHPVGRSALMTYRTRADFDNVFAGPTLPFDMASMDFTDLFDGHRALEQDGGEWTPVEDNGGDIGGYAQTSTAGDARGLAGIPTEDQVIEARIRLDQSGTSPSGTWFGLFARYVDARTHYYLSVRSTGELQIRKQNGGVISVLASVPYTVAAGTFHDYRLSVIANELHASVDGQVVATARDATIPRGRFGVGMYRSAATFAYLNATQP